MSDEILSNLKDADFSKATKSMQMYLELKKEYQDKILMYRIGDFYETFFEDAINFSKVCNITLTSKKYGEMGRVALAGIPSKTLSIYVKQLLENNFKVALAEQFQDDNGDFYRKVVRVYSPATVYETELLEPDKNNYLAAICKNKNSYGFSYCDVSEGAFCVTYGTKEEINREIVKISPKEILVNLEEMIFEFRDSIDDLKSVLICPNYFNKDKISLPEGEFQDGYLCANAILNYLFENQKEFAPKLDEIKKYSISNFLSMDFITRKGLELTRTQADFKKRGTLFWFLDSTKTPMGRRLLREWMSSPLNNIENISKRKNILKEFCSKPSLRKMTNEFLNDFCDLLRYSAKISNKTITYKELIEISCVLAKALKINDILAELKQDDLEINRECVEILNDFSSIITRTFDDEESCKNFEYLPVKEGVNPRLDLLRDELDGLNNKLLDLLECQKNNIHQDAKIKYMPNIGYCYEVPVSAYEKLNPEHIVKQRLSSVLRYADKKLVELEEKICSQKYAISTIEKDIFEKLRIYCMELTEKIRVFARVSAYLDVINSLSNCILENDFCEVNFNENSNYELKESMHPCVYKLKGDFVKNDVVLNKEKFSCILTGANMSGKSTYLKQNALCVILSQMYGFTCAKSAAMPLFDKVFFHSMICDNLKEGESTFFAEMKNIAYILNNSTQKSLILFDEPAKGTIKDDSEALLLAILEFIERKILAKTITATHFVSVARKKQNCSQNEILVIDEKTRKIQKGVCVSSNAYDVALEAGIDKSIIDAAKTYSLS